MSRYRTFPKNVMSDTGQGEGSSTASNSRHLMAVSLLIVHQIFMLAFAWLRVEREAAQVLVVSQPPPLAFLVFHLSDWWEACATSAAVGGGAPGPGPQERGTGRGRLPPHTASLEVTRPEPRNDRRNTRKAFSFPYETSTQQ